MICRNALPDGKLKHPGGFLSVLAVFYDACYRGVFQIFPQIKVLPVTLNKLSGDKCDSSAGFPQVQQEFCKMIIDCCVQQRSYEKLFQLLARLVEGASKNLQ